MSDMVFRLDGLDDLAKDLTKASTLYPDETERAIKRMATRFCKDAKDNAPEAYDFLAQKWWKKHFSHTANNSAMEVNIVNASNVHHLVENGHEKWFMGNHIGGWVAGKHYTERTRQQWESSGKVAEELNKVCNSVFKKVNL